MKGGTEKGWLPGMGMLLVGRKTSTVCSAVYLSLSTTLQPHVLEHLSSTAWRSWPIFRDWGPTAESGLCGGHGFA